MNKLNIVLLAALLSAPLIFNACSSGFEAISAAGAGTSTSLATNTTPNTTPVTTPTSSPTSTTTTSLNNMVPISVGDCGTGTYFNEPCVSVTICTPGTEQCQTIPHVLLDTGSYGLRLFSSAIAVSLTPQVDSSGRSIVECAHFGTGSTWGPVKTADVQLGSEARVQVPVQVIDATLAGAPTDCTDMDSSAADSGWNGILGIGTFIQDCGAGCTTKAANDIYFACSGATCTGTTRTLAQQVTNPVAVLPTDNNGLIISFPSVALAGAATVQGTMTFGIGTQSNNQAPALTTLQMDTNGNVATTYNGKSYSAFLDTGSNGLYFAGTGLGTCKSLSGFFCPTSLTTISSTLTDANSKARSIALQIGNADSLYATSQTAAFPTIGGSTTTYFDLGLPFYFGKVVYMGIENKSSSLGSGGYWAY